MERVELPSAPPPPPPVPVGGFTDVPTPIPGPLVGDEEELAPNSARVTGLGRLQVLPDEILSLILRNLSAPDLDTCALLSRFLFLLARDDALWRSLCLDAASAARSASAAESREQQLLVFKGTWRDTFIESQPKRSRLSWDNVDDVSSPPPRRRTRTLDPAAWAIRSHHLHRRWLRSVLDVRTLDTPRSPSNGLPILDPSNSRVLSRNVKLGLPFLLPASATASWPAGQTWHPDALCQSHGSTAFRAGAGNENNTARSIRHADMLLGDYLNYCERNADESPLYIFDPHFAERAPGLLTDYRPFGGDLFGPDAMQPLDPRPMDFRWLVLGPMRSGASWHVDPLGTSAWNALLFGRKRWALYPPGPSPPPGVRIDTNAGRIEAPSSLEWFLDVYPHLGPEQLPIEFVQQAGETVFVPAGWWHAILNLDQINVAVTQNLLQPSQLPAFANEAAARFPEPVFRKVAAQLSQDNPTAKELLETAAKFAQPSMDPLVLESGCKTLGEFISLFADPTRFVSQLEAVSAATGVQGPFTKVGDGTAPVYFNGDKTLVVKLFPHISSDGKAHGSELVSRARLKVVGMEGLVPPFLFSGEAGQGGPWNWPFAVMPVAHGESLLNRRRIRGGFGEAGLANWVGTTVRLLHHLPVVEPAAGATPRSYPDWWKLFNRLWDGTFQARLGRLDPEVRSKVEVLLTESSAEELLSSVPESERATMLHSDLHAGNVFGSESTSDDGDWKPHTLLDFGDSFHLVPSDASDGRFFDAAWDFVPILQSTLRLDPVLISQFLEVYGASRDTLRRALLYSLVWEYNGALELVVERLKWWDGEGDVLDAIWGFRPLQGASP